jgi:hypothetical protein
MSQKIRILTFGTLILLAALACSLTPTPAVTPEVPDGAVETSVAETLAASTESPEPESPTETSPAPALPDLHIVYVDDGDLWLWTEAGGSMMLYSGETVGDVLLSPDAELVAFTTIDSNYRVLGLWRIRTDGSDLQRQISGPDFVAMSTNPDALGAEPYRLEFRPGTHTLAFNTNLVFEGPGLAIQDDIRLLDMETGALSVFQPVGSGGNFYFSPDGSRIVITTASSVDVIMSDGTGRVDDVITFPFVNTASEFAFYPTAQWSPDGTNFRVVIPSAEPFGPTANFELFEVTADGLSITSLGIFPGTFAHFPDGTAISPNGQYLAFMQQTGGVQDLHVVEFGASDTVYDSQVSGFAGWNPTSTHLIYQKQGSLWIVQPGGTPAQLDGSPSARNAIWLPDGRYLYTSGSFGSFSLRLGSLGSGSILVASPTADFVVFDAVP